jgi:antibiotic biosynthesis monooxygenase (ABM) superfamily enzyme
MTNEASTTNSHDRLTVVVSRRIKPGGEAEFEKMKKTTRVTA